jgi:hypothetical protein
MTQYRPQVQPQPQTQNWMRTLALESETAINKLATF